MIFKYYFLNCNAKYILISWSIKTNTTDMFWTTTPTQVCRSTSFCELCNPKQKQQEPASEKIHKHSYDLASFFLTFHNPCTCPSWKSQQIYKTINKSVRCNYTLVQVHPSQLQSKLHRACRIIKIWKFPQKQRDMTHLQIQNDKQPPNK